MTRDEATALVQAAQAWCDSCGVGDQPSTYGRLVQAVTVLLDPAKCITCHDEGVLTVADGGPDRDGNHETAEIPCPMCTDTWADRDDYEQSRADHHRELENEV